MRALLLLYALIAVLARLILAIIKHIRIDGSRRSNHALFDFCGRNFLSDHMARRFYQMRKRVHCAIDDGDNQCKKSEDSRQSGHDALCCPIEVKARKVTAVKAAIERFSPIKPGFCHKSRFDMRKPF